MKRYEATCVTCARLLTCEAGVQMRDALKLAVDEANKAGRKVNVGMVCSDHVSLTQGALTGNGDTLE